MKLNKLILLMGMVNLFTTTIPANAATTLWSPDYNHGQSHKINGTSIIPATKPAVWETNDNKPMIAKQTTNHEIYYNIDPNQPSDFQNLWQTAMQKWSDLGVIQLVRVSWNDNRAILHAHGYDDYAKMSQLNKYRIEADNYAETNLTTQTNNQIAQITDAELTLYPNLNRITNNQTRLSIAEHEIGHALGFAHDSQYIMSPTYHQFVPVIMNKTSIDPKMALGNIEKQGLEVHYH